MRLEKLIPRDIMPSGADAVSVRGLSCDSRTVRHGYLFAALCGTHDDGASYVDDACARGASVILSHTPCSTASVPMIISSAPRVTLAQIAARFFAYQPSYIGAVTGTNGKTSVVELTRALLSMAGYCAASMGTLGIRGATQNMPLSHTTSEPITLHMHLRALYAQRVSHLMLEASSHGLAQARLDAVRLCVAGFTNISRDHMDYHATPQDYFAAKARLFTEILPRDGIAVIDVSSQAGQDMAERAQTMGREVLTVGTDESAIYVRVRSITPYKQHITIHIDGQDFDVDFPILGDFQRINLQLALGLAWQMGGATVSMRDSLVSGVAGLEAVSGRLENIGKSGRGAKIFVDYAHTPDALRTVLKGLRAHVSGRLIVVFGCGGERDAGKRTKMGAIAHEFADYVIITDDNPRHEDPAMIRAEIAMACEGADNIGDRAEAIAHALKLADMDDVVLVAGKGHESVQIIGEQAHDFNDADIIRAQLRQGEDTQ